MRHTSLLLLIAIGVCTLVTTGCQMMSQTTRFERSPIMTEQILARDLVFTPARHGSGIGPSLDLTGDGGLGIAVTDVTIAEKRAAVFECEHGQFVIERDELWSKLHEGATYTCRYVELYRTVYDHDTLVSRTLIDYDFLGLQEFPELMEEPNQQYQEIS